MKVVIGKEPYYVRWRHTRDDYGETDCYIMHEDGEIIDYDVAICAADDQFCKDTNRKISLQRTLKRVFDQKWVRKLFWQEYAKMTHKRWQQ